MPSGVHLDFEFSLPKIRGNYKQAGDGIVNVVDMICITNSLDILNIASDSCTDESTVAANPVSSDISPSEVSVAQAEAAVDDHMSISSQRPSMTSQAAAGRHAKPSVPPMKVGTLKKDGHGIISSWKTRHFVLLKGKLTYYEKPSFVEPFGTGVKGSSDLANMHISQIPNIPQYRMLLQHQNDKKVKSYVIEAANQKELQDWILAIDDHIEYATNNNNIAVRL